MKALFEARVEDLRPGDLVIAECRCGHSLAISTVTLVRGRRLPEYARIMDLEPPVAVPRMRREGQAVVSIRWGNQADT